jgi:hypothetical protein
MKLLSSALLALLVVGQDEDAPTPEIEVPFDWTDVQFLSNAFGLFDEIIVGH